MFQTEFTRQSHFWFWQIVYLMRIKRNKQKNRRKKKTFHLSQSGGIFIVVKARYKDKKLVKYWNYIELKYIKINISNVKLSL